MPGLLALLATWGVAGWWFRDRDRDMVALSLVGTSVGLVVHATGLSWWWDVFDFRDFSGGLITFMLWSLGAAIFTLAVAGSVGVQLRRLAAEAAPEAGSAPAPAPSGGGAPGWLLQLPVAAGAWLAALFLLLASVGLVAFVRGFSGGFGLMLGFLGLGLTGYGLLVYHSKPESLFVSQLAVALSGGGQLAALAGAGIGLDVPPLGLVGLSWLLTAALYVPFPHSLHRFLSVLASVLGTVAVLLGERLVPGAHLAAAAAAVAALALLTYVALARTHRPAVMALAAGAALGELGIQQSLRSSWIARHAGDSGAVPAAWLLALAGAGILAWAAGRLDLLRRAPYSVALTVLAAVALLGTPGILMALLFLGVGFLRRDLPLSVLGTLLLPLFLSHFYYQVAVDLYTKSFVLLGGGVALLLARLLLPAEGDATSAPRPPRRPVGLALASLLVAAALGAQVARREIRLAGGSTFFLQLRPRDPRSLMQGDSMVLGDSLLDREQERARAAAGGKNSGTLVVTLDDRQVASLARFDASGEIAPGERRLRFFRGREGRFRATPESFFFQEGRGSTYARARFAEVRVTPEGELTLVDLRGEQLERLVP